MTELLVNDFSETLKELVAEVSAFTDNTILQPIESIFYQSEMQ